DTTGTISIPVLANNIAHGNLSFFLNITGLTNATAFVGQAVGTIVDAANFGLSVGDFSIQQGPSVTADVPVYLSAPASHDIHFTVQAVDGSAVHGTDYTAPNPATVYTITAGQGSTVVHITRLTPTGTLGIRSFSVQLPSGDANYLQQTGTVTIFGTGAIPSATAGDVIFYSKAFNAGQTVKVPVQLSFASDSTVTVNYS